MCSTQIIMNNKKLKNLLSIIIISISSLIIIEYFTGRLTITGPDQGAKYVAASQIADGEGLTRPAFNPEDISQPIKQIHTSFPPGISVIASPLFLLFDDVQVIHVVFALLNLVLFLYLLYKLLKELLVRVDLLWLSLMFLFFTLNGVFLNMAGTDDFMCINIFILSAILILKFYRSGKKRKYLLWACLLLPLTVYFRYAYLPALIVLPAFFLWRIAFNKSGETKELIYSIVFTTLFALPFLAHIIFLNMETGYIATRVGMDGEKTFYLENFTRINPFPMNAFFDKIPFLRFVGFAGFGYDRGYDYPYILHILFYVASAIVLLPVYLYYRKHIPLAKFKSNSKFGLYAFIFSIGIIFFIFLATLINPSFYSDFNWSYAKLFRYFMLPAFFIQITYFLIILNLSSSMLKKAAFVILAASLLYSSALKSYNYIVNYKPFDFAHNTSIMRENNSLYNTYSLHLALQRDNELPGVALVDYPIKDRFDRNDLFLGMNGITTTIIDDAFDAKLRTSGKVCVYVIIDEPSVKANEILSIYNAELFKRLNNDIYVYSFVLTVDKEFNKSK